MDILQYSFFQNALWGSLFTCIACGITGTYIVSRRLVFISGGITHASFGGLGLGFFLGINPIFSALIFSIMSALGVEWLSKKQGVREDSAIAALWALGMALGIIFIFLTPGYAPNLSAYLFGNILLITSFDLLLLGMLAISLAVAFFLFFDKILYTAFDSEFAQMKRIKASLIQHLMMFAIAVTIVCSIRLVGVMLLMSLMTIPQMTANLFTSRFRKIIIFSIFLGIIGCFGGLFLSYYINVPSGAAVVLVQACLYLLAKVGTLLFRKTLSQN